ETLTLAKASRSGAMDQAVRDCLPAEVQVVRIGDVTFVGWPGEVFVEFAIEIRHRFPGTQIITLANGELQGYLVTQAAVDEKGYEASNALFASPAGAEELVEATQQLLAATSAAAR